LEELKTRSFEIMEDASVDARVQELTYSIAYILLNQVEK
jgi:hypothetical protein